MGKVAFRHQVEFAGFAGGSALLSVLPFSVQRGLAGALGWLGGSAIQVRRDVVDANLRLAFPEETAAWRGKVARASYRHLIRETLATARFVRLGLNAVRARVRFEDYEEVRDAVAQGKGLLMVSGHLGNWELAGATLAARGFAVAAVAARQTNPLFNRYVRESRQQVGLEVVFRSEGLRPLTQALHDGKVLGLVADQNAQSGSVFVDFFGVPAATAKGPAILALRSGAPLYMGACVREPGGNDEYRGLVKRIPIEEGDTAEQVVQRYTTVFESWVRRYPDQYFWHHRRWKTRPPGE